MRTWYRPAGSRRLRAFTALAAIALVGASLAACSTSDNASAPSGAGEDAAESGEHVALVTRFLVEGLNGQDLAVLEETHHPEHVGIGNIDLREGVQEEQDFFAGLFEAFPDYAVEISKIADGDDVVMTHYRISGTMENAYLGNEPTGQPFDIRAVGVFHIRDGRIAESDIVVDSAHFFQQLGIEPHPGPAER